MIKRLSILNSIFLFSSCAYSFRSLIMSMPTTVEKLPLQTTSSKEIILIRHGTTEMNERLSAQGWGSKNFKDACLWDTRLSSKGIEDAKMLNKRILSKDSNIGDFSRIECLVCSPLTRALQTAEIGLAGDIFKSDILKIVHPLARERLYLSSDVGRSKTELQKDYSNWNYDFLDDTNWWYLHPKDEKYIEWRPPGIYPCHGEIESYFKARMKKLREFLIARPEKVIAVVCHWGVIRSLTGRSLDNCEVLSWSSDSLLEEPYIDK